LHRKKGDFITIALVTVLPTSYADCERVLWYYVETIEDLKVLIVDKNTAVAEKTLAVYLSSGKDEGDTHIHGRRQPVPL
jgi:hypothetical protein